MYGDIMKVEGVVVLPSMPKGGKVGNIGIDGINLVGDNLC